ncbi:unnamed protein product, partial [marine sediment metagenome]
MAENTPNDPDQGTARGAAAARRNLHNVLVLALVDGRLSSEEKAHIESLRESLGIDRAEFARLCQEVTEGDKRILLPKTADEAVEAMAMLVELAAADGRIAPAEKRTLRKIADHIGVRTGKLDEMIAGASGPPEMDDIQFAAITE